MDIRVYHATIDMLPIELDGMQFKVIYYMLAVMSTDGRGEGATPTRRWGSFR